MPKDNNITNSDEQNAATNQEAESHKNNIPGDVEIKSHDITSSNAGNKTESSKRVDESTEKIRRRSSN